MTWAHPPVRRTVNGVNASINLDTVICIVCDEVLLGTASESSVSTRKEDRIIFVVDMDYSVHWSFDSKHDFESALSVLRRLGAWQ